MLFKSLKGALLVLVFFFGMFSMTPVSLAVGFTGLGGGSRAYGISANGTTATGYVGNQTDAFLWSPPAAATPLPKLPGTSGAQGNAVSANGQAIAGVGYGPGISKPWRWTSALGTADLGALPGKTYGSANAISSDGSVVVGTISADPSGTSPQAFRWTQAGMVGLGGGVSDARGVSEDGNVVVGQMGSSGFRWTAQTGMNPVGTFQFCSAISADGLVIAGTVGEQAFRWTQANGMSSLGKLGANYSSYPMALSANGSTIVGYNLQNSPTFDWAAIIWTPSAGTQRFQDVLAGMGVNLIGWKLNVASAVSSDGRTLAGWGDHNGIEEAWIATIPEPASGLAFASSALLACRRRPRV